MVHTFFAVIRCQYYLLQKHIPVRTYLFRLTKIIVALLLEINKLAFRKASLILLNPTRIVGLVILLTYQIKKKKGV